MERMGTSHSQQPFIPMHTLEQSAPEVVKTTDPSYEKYQSPPPPLQQQGSFFVPPEFETVPQQYPDAPVTALVAPPMDDRQIEDDKRCGIRRGLLPWLLGIGGLVLLVIAIGVGVGVGISGQTHSSPTGTTSPGNAAGGVAPTATSTITPSATPIGSSCSFANNSQALTSNGKHFVLLCGIDYSGGGEATDLGNLKASTFEKCIEQCAKETECAGAGWGPKDRGDNTYRETCWMKKDLKQGHVATEDWHFAVLVTTGATNGTVRPSASITATLR